MRLDKKFENRSGVYIIRNIINGKYYVGESLNVGKRIYIHCYGGDQVIHKAIKKYGIDSFRIYVEYLDNFSKKDLVDLEEKLIISHNSLYPNGYNICPKGSDYSGCKQTDEAKKKKSIALTGIKRSPEEIQKSSKNRTGLKRTPTQIANISNSHKGLVYGPCSDEKKQKISNILKEKYKTEPHPVKGYKHTEEFRKKLSLEKQGISNVLSKKPILQIDPQTNYIIKEWESTSDAVLSLFNDKTKASSISAALRGRYKTAFGFKWSFK
jgi:group I intron endonuclease